MRRRTLLSMAGVMRCAAAGERIVTLNGEERTLAADDLVIAGPREAIAAPSTSGCSRSAGDTGSIAKDVRASRAR
jgi:hypothetical protein